MTSSLALINKNIFQLIIRIYLAFCFLKLIHSIDPATEIYYKEPFFSLKNTNLTIGAFNYVGKIRNSSLIGFSESFSSICQSVIINSKNYPITIDGIINLVMQEFNSFVDSGQGAVLKVLSNNLYYASNNTKLNYESNVDLAGLISNSNFGTAKINNMASNGFGLPFITAGDLARANPDNQFSGDFEAMKYTFAQTQVTSEYNVFNATLQILNYFNWTLVANLYQSNTFGYTRQKDVLEYVASNYSPKFACNTVFNVVLPGQEETSKASVETFCKCVTSKATINVIMLWMSTSASYSAIDVMRKYCSAAKKWTFIITDDFQNPVNYNSNLDSLSRYSLYIRDNGPWNVKNFVEECQRLAPPEAKKTIMSLFRNYYRESFSCELYPELADQDLKKCVNNNITARFKNCICTLDETDLDPYSSRIFFLADSVTVYAAAISLLQNNCTLLNEKRSTIKHEFDWVVPDFCNITQFTPKDLSYAIRFVNFTGYTGQIWFPQDNLKRAVKSFYVYNPSTDLINAPLVGTLNSSGAYFNDNSLKFVDGEVPKSEIVPQNADLSYAVVDVFFGLSIVYLIIAAYMLFFFIYYRNHREIRKGAPIITLVMLIGVAGIAFTQLILSLGKYDGTCPLFLYFYWLSLVLLLTGLLGKNYRIYKIFSNKSASALVITEGKLLLFVGIVFFVYAIIITIIVAVLGFEAVLKQSTKDEYYQYIECAIPNTTWNKIFEIVFQLSQLVPLVASLILAWLTRKIRAEYAESRELAAFSIIVFFALIIFLPLIFTLTDESQSEVLGYVIYVEILSITIISAFCLLFAPKMYAFYKYNKKIERRRREISMNRTNVMTSNHYQSSTTDHSSIT